MKGAIAIRFIVLVFMAGASVCNLSAQAVQCTFKKPFFLLHFGAGNVRDVNATSLALYDRVSSSCPSDGHYTFTAYTSDCFNGDWHTLTEDHTPGDVNGNMLLVNSAYNDGLFFITPVSGFKGATIYQFGAWLMNVCKPSDKCPYPLLPNLTIRLQTRSGKTVAQFVTGDLPRTDAPRWIQHRATFTVPVNETELILSMVNTAPGGCGNDFALDDITFQECVKTPPPKPVVVAKVPPPVAKKEPVAVKKKVDKPVPLQTPVRKESKFVTVSKNVAIVPGSEKPVVRPQTASFVPAPLVLKQRANTLVRQIETAAGELLIDLYDNGEIDGDTVSIYHNNVLVMAEQRLSQKPIRLRIQVDKDQPHHELVMVANNLGSIPPNTSLMIVTTKEKRYQVYISSSEQQNAKVVIDLKE